MKWNQIVLLTLFLNLFNVTIVNASPLATLHLKTVITESRQDFVTALAEIHLKEAQAIQSKFPKKIYLEPYSKALSQLVVVPEMVNLSLLLDLFLSGASAFYQAVNQPWVAKFYQSISVIYEGNSVHLRSEEYGFLVKISEDNVHVLSINLTEQVELIHHLVNLFLPLTQTAGKNNL